jgi:hypothetical protein
MTSLLTIGALVAALGMPTTATHGAYCGPKSDTAAIQTYFLKEHAHDAHPVRLKDIMAIAVYNPGSSGQVTYQGAGTAAEYFAATSGGWRPVGTQPPGYFGKDAVRFFNRMQNLRASGGNECANPRFVASGSD